MGVVRETRRYRSGIEDFAGQYVWGRPFSYVRSKPSGSCAPPNDQSAARPSVRFARYITRTRFIGSVEMDVSRRKHVKLCRLKEGGNE
jgi:hypothetical protein